jgi:GNAT superfamily N-acetyltransferase
MAVNFEWRGAITNAEVNQLHDEAFETRVVDGAAWNWNDLLDQRSLGWVVARDDDTLVGFVNVLWDGRAHAWLQDTMVVRHARRKGIGRQLVALARDGALHAGCQWLHADYGEQHREFYETACGFAPTHAGLIALT